MKAATLKHCSFNVNVVISIHAAREGGDAVSGVRVHINGISIHAAREGGDYCKVRLFRELSDFNPRRP